MRRSGSLPGSFDNVSRFGGENAERKAHPSCPLLKVGYVLAGNTEEVTECPDRKWFAQLVHEFTIAPFDEGVEDIAQMVPD